MTYNSRRVRQSADSSSEVIDEMRERRYRRKLRAGGLSLRKSRTRQHFHINDQGECTIVDEYLHRIEAGDRYNLSLDGVEEFIEID